MYIIEEVISEIHVANAAPAIPVIYCICMIYMYICIHKLYYDYYVIIIYTAYVYDT